MLRHSNVRTFGASLLALVLVSTLNLPTLLRAQVTGGTISGTVTDSTGRVIAEARIEITNPATGINRTVTTNADGVYTAPNLQAGTYNLKFSATGFRTEERTGIVLTVGASVSMDLAMQVGKAIETVQVQSEAPAVQTSTSDISAV